MALDEIRSIIYYFSRPKLEDILGNVEVDTLMMSQGNGKALSKRFKLLGRSMVSIQ